jgi:hypothetical protein
MSALVRGRVARAIAAAVVIAVSIPAAVVAPRYAPFVWLLLAVSPQLGQLWGSRLPDGSAHPAADGVRPLPLPLTLLVASPPAPASFIASTSTWAAPTSPAAS